MKDLVMKKGSIFMTALTSQLAQVSVDLPAGADEVSTWVSIGGGAVYIGLNMPRIIRAATKLFQNNNKKDQ